MASQIQEPILTVGDNWCSFCDRGRTGHAVRCVRAERPDAARPLLSKSKHSIGHLTVCGICLVQMRAIWMEHDAAKADPGA